MPSTADIPAAKQRNDERGEGGSPNDSFGTGTPWASRSPARATGRSWLAGDGPPFPVGEFNSADFALTRLIGS